MSGPARSILVDGAPASPDDLAHMALVNYGAYTSFRVQDGAVRGLDRHLTRLDASAVELFGQAVGETPLRALMRQAVGDRADGWLRVSLFSRHITHRAATWQGAPSVMTVVSPPPAPLPDGARLSPQIYQREAPHLKHVSTFGLVRARRAAVDAGFDDALFVDERGRISEGSLWNIGFVSGDQVTWPQAPMLAGVTQALIQDGLAGVGLSGLGAPVSLDDLSAFDAAFLCNSATPACGVAAIGDHAFAPAAPVLKRLRAAWASNAPLTI